MTSQPLAQMVLAFSAVEELGQNQKWSEAQIALIRQLTAAAEASVESNSGPKGGSDEGNSDGPFPCELTARRDALTVESQTGPLAKRVGSAV
jgi:hypothetical protein